MRQSICGTVDSNGPTVCPVDCRQMGIMQWLRKNWKGKKTGRSENLPHWHIFHHKIPQGLDLRRKRSLRGEKPATNRPRYGFTDKVCYVKSNYLTFVKIVFSGPSTTICSNVTILFNCLIRDAPFSATVRRFGVIFSLKYEGWNFNSGNYLFTTDTKQIHVSKFYCPSM